jgi:hypothetical protein
MFACSVAILMAPHVLDHAFSSLWFDHPSLVKPWGMNTMKQTYSGLIGLGNIIAGWV